MNANNKQKDLDKYSVLIVTCCNRTKELNSLIKSVLSQDLPADEIIIVSDGKLGKGVIQNSIIKYIERPLIKYPAPHRNYGLSEVKNDLVFISDDDDLWHPKKARLQIITQKMNNAGLVFTEKKDFVESFNFDTIDDDVSHKSVSKNILQIRNSLPLSSVLFNKRLVISFFNEDIIFRAWEDWVCWIDNSMSNVKILQIDAPLLGYRISSDSIRSNKYLVEVNQLKWLFSRKASSIFIKIIAITIALGRITRTKISNL
jgi:glycosyltransferase involved in cell wall biosynthesis